MWQTNVTVSLTYLLDILWLSALTGALTLHAPKGSLSYELSYMRFRIPGTTVTARIVEAVETADPQYDVFDVGIEHEHGGIDSIVVGASAYSLKKAVANLNRTCDEKNAADTEAPVTTAAAWHPASSPPSGGFSSCSYLTY